MKTPFKGCYCGNIVMANIITMLCVQILRKHLMRQNFDNFAFAYIVAILPTLILQQYHALYIHAFHYCGNIMRAEKF